MLLGRVEVLQGHFAQAEVVVDRVVVRVLLMEPGEQGFRLRVLPFGVCCRGREEKIVPRLPLRREDATEQREG